MVLAESCDSLHIILTASASDSYQMCISQNIGKHVLKWTKIYLLKRYTNYLWDFKEVNKLASSSCKLKVFLTGTDIVFMKNDFSSLECDGNTKVGKMLRG